MPEFDMDGGSSRRLTFWREYQQAEKPRSGFTGQRTGESGGVALTCLGDAVRTSYGAPAAGTIIGIGDIQCGLYGG